MSDRIIRSIVIVLTVLCLSSLAAAETLTVTVEAQGDRYPNTALLEAYSRDPHAERLTVDVPLTAGRGRAVLELPEPVEREWRIQWSAEGLWAPEVDVSPNLGNLVHVELWPAGTLRGTFRAPPDGELPEEVELSLTTTSAEDGEIDQPEDAVTSCAVVDGSLDSCTVPAGTWHLRAKARGYVAHYLWGFSIPAAEEVDLGRLVLEHGASLVGRVVTESGPADPVEARVRLAPLIDGHTASEKERRELGQLTLTGQLNPWGYFHFEGIAPGSYEIVSRQAGFTPAELAPVSVSRGESVELPEPLILELPVRLAVTISPPESPSGEPWGVMFLGRDRFAQLEIVDEGHTDDGRWTSPAVSAGQYAVRVVDDSGDLIAWRDVELIENRQPLAIDLDLVWVEGKVVLGESPLAAQLWFETRNESARVEASSNEEGEFHVVVPREGGWLVDVSADDPVVRAEDLDAEIEAGADGEAEVFIELPDTTIQGEVVDLRGNASVAATVSLLQMDEQPKQTNTRTAEDGSFEIHGQEPGTWFLEAQAGNARSTPREVNLVEGSTTGPVRLVLKEERQFAGEVRGPAGAVPQAVIFGLPMTLAGGLPAVSGLLTKTGIDGSFEVDLPANSIAVRLVVLAPGFALHVERVSSDAEQPIVLQLQPEGGRLALRNSSIEVGRVPLLLIDGELVDALKLPILRRWAQTNGATPTETEEEVLSVPAMPPGSYAYCHVTMDEALLVVAGAAQPSTSACSEGYLPPGGELELDRAR